MQKHKRYRDDKDDPSAGGGGYLGGGGSSRRDPGASSLLNQRAPATATTKSAGSTQNQGHNRGAFKKGTAQEDSEDDYEEDEAAQHILFEEAYAAGITAEVRTEVRTLKAAGKAEEEQGSDYGEGFVLTVDGQETTFHYASDMFRATFAVGQTKNRDIIARTCPNRPPNTCFNSRKGSTRALFAAGGKSYDFKGTPSNVSFTKVRNWLEEVAHYVSGHSYITAIGFLMNANIVADEELRSFPKKALMTKNQRPGDGSYLTFPGDQAAIASEPDEVQKAILTYVMNAWMFSFFADLYTKSDVEDRESDIKSQIDKMRMTTACFSTWTVTYVKLELLVAELEDPKAASLDKIIKQVVKNTAEHFNCPEIQDIFNAVIPTKETGTSQQKGEVLAMILKNLAIRHKIDLRRDGAKDVKVEVRTRDNSQTREPQREPQRNRNRDYSRDRDAYPRDRSRDRQDGDRRSSITVHSTRQTRDRSSDRPQRMDSKTRERSRDRSGSNAMETPQRYQHSSVQDLPTKHESEATAAKEHSAANVMAIRRFMNDNRAKYDTLAAYHEVVEDQNFHDATYAEIRSLVLENPEQMKLLEIKAERRAAEGHCCKFCGLATTHEGGTVAIPREHMESTCMCTNQATQQLDAWRVVRFYGATMDSLNMILDSIRTQGAFKNLPPNKFNDFRARIEEEMVIRANKKQQWILNNRNNTTPVARSEGYQRYGPVGGQR